MSKLTQIALDFGEEPQSPPVPPTAGNGTVEDPARPYLAASGVGVRVKSFKQPVPPPSPDPLPEPAPEDFPARPVVKIVNGDLFGTPVPESPEEGPMVAGPALAVEPMEAAEPEMVKAAEELKAVMEPEPVMEEPAPLVEPELVAAAEPEVAGEPEPVVEAGPVVVEAEPAAPEAAPVVIPAATEAEPGPRRRTPPGRGIKQPSKRGRKSLKQVAAEAELIEIPADEVLFSKQYYTMGEVAAMFQVNQSLLRFWETEFDILQPKKNKKGDRYFRPIDIKNLHLIYHLLRQKKYTIEGAKEFLKKNKKAEDRFEVIKRLEQIKAFLVEWKAQL